MSAVNAVSETLLLEIKRGGKRYVQHYARGVPLAPLEEVGPATDTGTRVTFKPDHEIFSSTEFSFDILNNRLRELAFLNAGFDVTFTDERTDRKVEHRFDGGLRQFIETLNKGKEALHDSVIHLKATLEGVEVELAMQWSDSYNEAVYAYTNNVHNKDGGTHLTGLRTALTRLVNTYGTEKKLLKDLKAPLSGEDVREGLTCIVAIKHPDPAFSSQTKDKLVSSEVKGIVEGVVGENLNQFFEENPIVAKRICEKAVIAARAREAARKARELSLIHISEPTRPY